jgi:hypothetical protein
MTFAHRGLWLAAAAAVVTASGVAPIAWSSTADGRHGTRPSVTLNWKVAIATQDRPPAGPSNGDTLQATYTLTGRSKGSADFACTAVGPKYLCQGVIRLPDGDLYAQVGPDDETQPAAIVGGTRTYDGARGQFTQVEVADGRGTWSISLR